MTLERQAKARNKAYFRSIIAIAMITVWSAMVLTGFLLYVAPSGPRSGRLPILFLTKGQWGNLHFWIGLLAISVTFLHVIIDWKALRGCIRYLASLDRSGAPRE